MHVSYPLKGTKGTHRPTKATVPLCRWEVQTWAMSRQRTCCNLMPWFDTYGTPCPGNRWASGWPARGWAPRNHAWDAAPP